MLTRIFSRVKEVKKLVTVDLLDYKLLKPSIGVMVGFRGPGPFTKVTVLPQLNSTAVSKMKLCLMIAAQAEVNYSVNSSSEVEVPLIASLELSVMSLKSCKKAAHVLKMFLTQPVTPNLHVMSSLFIFMKLQRELSSRTLIQFVLLHVQHNSISLRVFLPY